MKKNRLTRVPNRPRGHIFGARWHGLPCEARACKILIGVAPPSWWCANMIGEELKVVEVLLPDGPPVYIDNQDGWALTAMLRGLAPLPKFRFAPAFVVMDDPESEIFYKP
jgi:hypothetical protein